jgi:hypothetical protein
LAKRELATKMSGESALQSTAKIAVGCCCHEIGVPRNVCVARTPKKAA